MTPTETEKLHRSAEHVERIRQKVKTAEGLGPFWRDILLGALNSLDAERTMADKYGLALMMIREGCAEPQQFAAKTLAGSEARPAPAGTQKVLKECRDLIAQLWSGPHAIFDKIDAAISSGVPAPAGMREALALAREVLEPFAKAAQAYLRPDDSVDEMFDIGEAEFINAHKAFNIIEAALFAPSTPEPTPSNWVMVTKENPLPDDLKPGDEVETMRRRGKIISQNHIDFDSYTDVIYTESITAYRRSGAA